jgi:glycosyltransferase involved in cell wall biosynthesis
MTTIGLERSEALPAERTSIDNPQSAIVRRRAHDEVRNSQSISALVITKNEAENIRDCLASLQWVDEIVVVDAESADGTVAFARAFTDKIFVRPWAGFAAAKEFALAQCTGEWVLWIDADERVTPALRDEIIAALGRNPAAVGFEMPRLANFLGKWIRHGGWYPGYVLRLFRREAGRFNEKQVHEGVQIAGEIGRLKNHLLHYTDSNLQQYFEKLNRYTSLAAEELHRRGRRFHLWDLLLRPGWFFFRMYVLKVGFLDGVHGFILALLSAMHVLTKYAKLWEKQKG